MLTPATLVLVGDAPRAYGAEAPTTPSRSASRVARTSRRRTGVRIAGPPRDRVDRARGWGRLGFRTIQRPDGKSRRGGPSGVSTPYADPRTCVGRPERPRGGSEPHRSLALGSRPPDLPRCVLLSSVRTRLFLVIAGLAFLSSLAISAVRVATEPARVDIRADGAAIAELYDQTVRLSNAIRDQEAAIDDYLLAGAPEANTRYAVAVQTEFRVEERMRQIVLITDEYPAIAESLSALTIQTQLWRQTFGDVAFELVKSGSTARIAELTKLVADDQDPTLASVDQLVQHVSEAEDDVAR